VAATLEALEKAEAEKRKAQAPGKPRGAKDVSPGKLLEHKGQVRDRVAAVLGVCPGTRSGKPNDAGKGRQLD